MTDVTHQPLIPDLIDLTNEPETKPEAIESLLDLAVEAGRVDDREQALADLRAREAEATTGVGMGIGIPHAKSEAVVSPTIAFMRAPDGIDFDSMDDEPVRLLFLLLVPAQGGDEHLQMLSSLSRSLMHEETRTALLEADSPGRIESIVLEAVE
ncbi:MAG: fructose PTS transporter subunit IIA [Euryarchaeota archaeon]|nr:fructose PTS transporter subunit IIA [Euryarchaeota archaeon]